MFSKADLKNEIKHELHAFCILWVKQLQFKLLKVAGTTNTVANCVNFQRDGRADYYQYQKYVQNCFDNLVF